MTKRSSIAVFASGNGSNAEEIFRYFANHADTDVVLLLTNNSDAYVLDRAEKFNISTWVVNKREFSQEDFLLKLLKEKNVTHIVLAGFLLLVPKYLIRAFPDKIINIHPALLPKYGGKGMYGKRVHEAVRQSGDSETGMTIHVVNENYDEGRILFQAKCQVTDEDTPAEIASKVHQLEHASYPKVIEGWIHDTLPT